VCSPTRAALLTGRYPDIAGVPGVIRTDPTNSWGYLSTDVPLLPALLKRAGYESALIGKWHLGLTAPNTPNLRGFDHFHGFLGDMMDDYYNHRRHGNNYMRLNEREIQPQGHATDLFSDWAVEYVRGRRSRPFFLYLAYNAPHVPVQPPADWLERVRKREPAMDPKRAALAAFIEHMDSGIGRVLDALRASGAERNTVVIFTSDNGGQLDVGANCGPLRSGKGSMYEGGIRVPMCAMWPGRLGVGEQSRRVGMTMDLFPTICEAAGAAAPGGLDGVSLLGAERERSLVWVRREGGADFFGREYHALRRGPWKLLHNRPLQPYELYNLDADPGEQTNRAQTEKKVFSELSAELARHLQRAGRVPWQPPEISRSSSRR
jgi:arylsulfatase A-like enzyme